MECDGMGNPTGWGTVDGSDKGRTCCCHIHVMDFRRMLYRNFTETVALYKNAIKQGYMYIFYQKKGNEYRCSPCIETFYSVYNWNMTYRSYLAEWTDLIARVWHDYWLVHCCAVLCVTQSGLLFTLNELPMCYDKEAKFQRRNCTDFAELFIYSCDYFVSTNGFGFRSVEHFVHCMYRPRGCTWRQTLLWSN